MSLFIEPVDLEYFIQVGLQLQRNRKIRNSGMRDKVPYSTTNRKMTYKGLSKSLIWIIV